MNRFSDDAFALAGVLLILLAMSSTLGWWKLIGRLVE
jgi:hypothetical protein